MDTDKLKYDLSVGCSMRLDLEELKQGLPTLTATAGSFFMEAALYCLRHFEHQSGVAVSILEGKGQGFEIAWTSELDPRAEYSYADHDEATEYGATAIAVLYAVKSTGYNTIERSVKGDGFDYWVGNYEGQLSPPFSRSERLEISGLFKGAEKDVKSRFQIKRRQISKSDHLSIPKIVFILEFSNPAAAVERVQ